MGDAAGMRPDTERLGDPLLELMAWNELEIEENQGCDDRSCRLAAALVNRPVPEGYTAVGVPAGS